MDEIIELLHDYVTMAARVATGEDMQAGDRARWLAFLRVIPGTGHAPEPCNDDESSDGIPVQITAPGGFETARMLAVSRDGIRLSLVHPLPVGSLTLVRVIAPRAAVEYTFPCRVVWSTHDAMGLEFDGEPTRVPLSKAMLVGWHRQLDLRTGWGAKPPSALA